MNNEIISKIADRLAEIFPDKTIYTEKQREGFDVPSFFIGKSLDQAIPKLCEVQDRTYGYQVVYFADPKAPNSDISNIEELLLDHFTDLPKYAAIQNREFKTDSDKETLVFNFDVFIRAFKVKDINPLFRKLKVNLNGRRSH